MNKDSERKKDKSSWCWTEHYQETTRRRGKTTQTTSRIGRKGEIVYSTATGERRQTKRKRKTDCYGI